MALDHQDALMSVEVTASGTTLSEQVATEIRAWMGRKRMSQAALARHLGVSQMWVSYRLNGVQPIDLNDLARIAAVLEINIFDLLPKRGPSLNDGSENLTRRGMRTRLHARARSGSDARPLTGPAVVAPPVVSTVAPAVRRPMPIAAERDAMVA